MTKETWNERKAFSALYFFYLYYLERPYPIVQWDLRSNDFFFQPLSQSLYPLHFMVYSLSSLCQHSGLYRHECFHLSKISTVQAYFGAKKINWPTTHRSILGYAWGFLSFRRKTCSYISYGYGGPSWRSTSLSRFGWPTWLISSTILQCEDGITMGIFSSNHTEIWSIAFIA